MVALIGISQPSNTMHEWGAKVESNILEFGG
jgi:hypothetical protein